MSRRSTWVLVAALLVSAVAAADAPSIHAMHSRVFETLVAGRDASALVAEERASVSKRAPAATAVPEASAGVQFAGALRLAIELVDAHDAGDAFSMEALDAALQSLDATYMLVAARSDARGAEHGKRLPQAALANARGAILGTAASDAMRTLRAARDAIASGGDVPPAVAAQIGMLRSRLEADTPRTRVLGNSLPQHRPRLPPRAPSSTPSIVPAHAAELGADAVDLAADTDAPLSPAIADKARSLGYDYVRIFDFVRSEIATEWYTGAQKGAEGALATMAGNDIDQASLLIALLRASGAPARYVRAVLEVPAADLAAMIAVPPSRVGQALTAAGVANEPVVSGGALAAFRIEHVYVDAFVPYANYRGASVDRGGKLWVPLAPSLKRNAEVVARDAVQRSGIVVADWVDAWLRGPQSQLPLPALREQVSSWLFAQTPPQAYDAQLARVTVNEAPLGQLPAGLPYASVATTGEWPTLPDELRQHVEVELRDAAGTTQLAWTTDVARVAGRRVTIAWIPATADDQAIVDLYGGLSLTPPSLVSLRAQLVVAGTPVAVSTRTSAPADELTLAMRFEAPAGEAEFSQSLVAGAYVAIATDVAGMRLAPDPASGATNGDTETDAARLLAHFGARYLGDWLSADDELARLLGVRVMRPFPSAVLVMNEYHVARVLGLVDAMSWQGVSLDAAFKPVEPIVAGAIPTASADWLALSSLHASALEHAQFEAQWRVDSVSADRAFSIASSTGIAIARLQPGGSANALTQLPAPVRESIDAWLRAGYAVDVPESPLAFQSWRGSAWRAFDRTTGESGYFISGGLAGGMTAVPPELWYYQDLAAALAAADAQPPNNDPLAGAIVILDRAVQDQRGEAGLELPQPLVARVRDRTGRPVYGAQVRFLVSQGGSQLLDESNVPRTAVTIRTDNRGMAFARLLLGQHIDRGVNLILPDRPNPQFVGKDLIDVVAIAERGDVLSGESYRAYTLPGAPASLAIKRYYPLTDLAPGIPNNPLRVQAKDQFENLVANVPITMTGTFEPQDYAGQFCDEDLVALARGPRFSTPGQCPTYGQPSPDLPSCEQDSVTVLTRTDGAEVLMTPPDVPDVEFSVIARSNAVTDTVQGRTQFSYSVCEPTDGPIWVAYSELAYVDYFGAASLGNGQSIEATRPGQVSPLPGRIFVREGIFAEGDPRPRWRPVPVFPPQILESFAVNLTNGVATNYRNPEPGMLEYEIRGGDQPGYIGGTWTIRSFFTLAPLTFTHHKIAVVDLRPPIVEPDTVAIDAFGAVKQQVRSELDLSPTDYFPAPWQTELLADGEVITGSGTDFGRDGLDALFPRGWRPDLEKDYSFRTVINDGTPFRMESAPVPLRFAGGVISGYGLVEESDPLAALNLVLGEYPRELELREELDIATGYTCTASVRFGFVLAQPARVTLTIRSLDGFGEPTFDIAQPLNDVLKETGYSDVEIQPDDLPFGVFQYELKAIPVAGGASESKVGLIRHEPVRRDSLSLAHSFVKGVDLFFGHPVVSSEDVAIGGRGPGLSFSRTWSGNEANRLGPMGWGWSSNLDASVTVDGCGRRHVNGSVGQAQPFVGEGPNGDGSYRYRALAGYHGTLVGRGPDYDFYAKDGTRYHFAQPAFDGAVRLSFVEDPDGNRVTYEYAGTADDLRVVAMRDGAGRSLRFEYERLTFDRNATGRPEDAVQDRRFSLTRVRGPGGIVVDYSYNGDGNLIAARRNAGRQGEQLEEFSYRSFGSVLVVDPSGGPPQLQFLGWQLETAKDALTNAARAYEYELQWLASRDALDITSPVRWLPQMRVVELTEPDDGTTNFSYTGLRGLGGVGTVVRDARSFETTYSLNQYGAATSVVDPAGTTETTWDMAAMQPQSVKDALGTVATYTYDDHGNRASERIAHVRAGSIERAWTYAPPDSFEVPIVDRLATARDGRGIVTTYQHDARGHRVQVARGDVTESDAYDARGDHASHTDGRGKTWTFRYDSFGYPSEQRDPLGNRTAMSFDERGRQLSERDPNDHETIYTYDERGREITRTLPRTASQVGNVVVRTSYDDTLRRRTDRDANGHETVTSFDLMGRPVRIRNALGIERAMAYDHNGNKTSETDFRGNATTFTYDGANRLTLKAEPEGRNTAYAYDELGHVVREVVGDGSAARTTEFAYEHPLYARTLTRRKLGTGWLETEEEYDANGNRTALVDALGRRTTWTYDDRDRPRTESGPLGHFVTTTYDASDHPLTQTTANGSGSGDQSRSWTYDDAGREMRTTDATNASREAEYDAKGNVVRRIDARRHATVLVYDARDRVVEERGPAAGQLTRRDYDAVGNLTREEWPNGRIVQHVHDELNRRTESTDNWSNGPSRVELLGYDADDHVISRMDANGHVTTTEYDGLGRKRVEHRPLGRNVSWTYNVHGDVLTETDARSFTWTHAYDDVGRRVATTTPVVASEATSYTTLVGYDAVGNVVTQTDANGNVTTFEYDERNRRKRQLDALVPDAAGSNVAYVQSWTYDEVGNVLTATDRRGIVGTQAYDKENRVVASTRDGITSTTRYDAEGNVEETRDGAGRRAVFTYDEANRKLTQVAAPDTPVAATLRWTWTPLGDVATQVDGENRTTAFTYDERRFLIAERNAANEETQYENDGLGQRTAMIRPNGADRDWHYAYDAADRLQSVTDPLGHDWTYGYDAGDHRTSIIDANAHETTFTFDELGRLATHAYPGGAAWTYAYDGAGNRTRSVSPNGVATVSTYDALNRMTRSTYSPIASGEPSETTQRYDGNGNLVRIADLVGGVERVTARTYDDRDRLASETDAYGRRLRYDYDNADNRIRRSDEADDVQTVWSYDARNRNDGVTDSSGTTRMAHYRDSRLREIVRPSGTVSTYEYDLAGRTGSIAHVQAGGTVARVEYDYDGNGNRTSERLTNGGPSRVTTYTYDRADRLASTSVAGGESVVYTLDPVGNRLVETRTGTGTTTITQTFNARDQLQSRTLSGAATGTTTYTWDANGNQKTEVEGATVTTNTWDARDRLIGIARTGEPDLTYVYDPEGLRIEAGDGGTGARFRYDAGHLYSEANGANQTTRRYRTNLSGPAQKGWIQAATATLTLFLGMTDTGATPIERNYLHDALTTPIAIERNDGALAQRSAYDAWGNVESEQVVDAELNVKRNRIGFTGYQLDRQTSEAGDTSYYAKARHYGAGTGVFRSVDPWAGDPNQPISFSKYLYAYANPGAHVDPSGRCSIDSQRCAYQQVVDMASSAPARASAERILAQYDREAPARAEATLKGGVLASMLIPGGLYARGVFIVGRAAYVTWAAQGARAAYVAYGTEATVLGGIGVETVAYGATNTPSPTSVVPASPASTSARALDAELDAMQPLLRVADDVPLPLSVVDDVPPAIVVSRVDAVTAGQPSRGDGVAAQSAKVQLSVAANSAGTAAHKQSRWDAYRARGGEWTYERWSNVYEQNMVRARLSNQAADDYHQRLGWGEREVTVDVEGVPRRLDIADVARMRGVEHKTGYQTATQENLWEIQRDQILIEQGWDLRWQFDDRASKPLVRALDEAKIPHNK